MRPGLASSRRSRRIPFDLNVIEVGGGLVRQEQRWIVDERAGDRHPLLLSAGQLGGAMVGALLQPDAGEEFVGPLLGRFS